MIDANLPFKVAVDRYIFRFILILFSTCLIAQATAAELYPNRLIKLVVPYPAGGGTDALARPLALQLSARLGQTVVVDNRGGAGGSIGMEFVARAPADGYTLLLALTPQLAVNGALYEKIPYDPIKSFSPISLIAEAPYLLLVNPALPVTTTKELLALAKAENGKLTYASSGSGSGAHMAAELLISMTGIPMTHIPYKGGGPALSDVLAGHVKVLFAPAVSSMQHIQSGRLRALATTGDKRLASLPNVPTIAESAVPGYESTVWYAVLAPPNTPREIVNRINAELLQILKDPAFRSMMNTNGIEPLGSTPEALNSYINKEITKWSKVIKGAGLKAE
jgi:tripartite-type tricarboxylate transporter receptor subunit TctC